MSELKITFPESFNTLPNDIKSIKNEIKELKENFPTKEPSIYIPRKGLAEELNVDVSTIHNWTKRGILIAFQIGGKIFYKRSQVEQQMVELNK